MLYGYVENLSDQQVTTAKHDVWSIKKLLVLDYYIKPFVKILRSNGFKAWYYVDPFSGSGLIKLKKKYLFPGSPLIPLFQMNEVPFSKYYLSDIKQGYINALTKRSEAILQNKNINLQFNIMDASKAISNVFTGKKPESWKDIGYLVFLDPYGLQMDWKSMERILKSGAVDIIFTFMTWAINWNRDNQTSQKTLTMYFGDDEWKNLRTNEDFVRHYCGKIEQLGYRNKYKTFTIDVIQQGRIRYNLILATQSLGGAKVLNDLKNIVNSVTTETINDAFSVSVGAKTDLDSFM